MIPIEKFFVASDFREEQEAIGELALSIERQGLIHPIAVRPVGDRFEVIAGRRRFYALRDYLKLTHLEEGDHYVVKEGMDALVCQLVENIDRKDFKPIEAARLIKAIHDRGVEEHGSPVRGHKGGWSIEDTAKLLGRTKGFISKMLKIAANEELAKNSPTIKDALDKIDKEKKKEVLSAVRKAQVSKTSLPDIEDYLSSYHNMDALSLLTSLEDNCVDLILTDPPYGIDLDTITPEDCYADSKDALLSTLRQCLPEMARVLRPDRYIIVWCSFYLFSTIYDLMVECGLSPSGTPIIWTKPNSTGRTTSPDQRLGSIAECAIYATSGPGAELSEKGTPNVFSVHTVRKDRVHPAQKPEALIEKLILTFSRKGDLVMDVFAGSASTLRACMSTGRKFIGCEVDEEFYNAGLSYTLNWLSKFHHETCSEEDVQC